MEYFRNNLIDLGEDPTPRHMGHIHFDEEAVNIFAVREGGIFGNCVTGEDGVWILII